MNNLNIQILSRRDMQNMFKTQDLSKHLVVSINDSSIEKKHMQQFKCKCKQMLSLHFSDLNDSELNYYLNKNIIIPKKIHMKKILKFTDNDEPVIVHCFAGIARSSASAYLIACQRTNDPNEAIKVLDPKLHYPNKYLIKLGAEILNNPYIVECFEKWNYDMIQKNKDQFDDILNYN